MKIFGFLKRRKEQEEAAKLLEAQRAKAVYQKRKKLITDFLDSEYEKRSNIKQKIYEENVVEAKKLNSICPNCWSTNVINLVKRSKGEIHGNGYTHTSLSSGILSSSYHNSSDFNINGDLDTYPVNKCNTCGNEWNVVSASYPADLDPYSPYDSFGPRHLSEYTYEYAMLQFDPFDRTEECSSLDEKMEKFLAKTQSSFWFDDYKLAPREVLEYLIFISYQHDFYSWDTNMQKFFAIKDDDDAYSYTMPDNVCELVKKVIGYKL